MRGGAWIAVLRSLCGVTLARKFSISCRSFREWRTRLRKVEASEMTSAQRQIAANPQSFRNAGNAASEKVWHWRPMAAIGPASASEAGGALFSYGDR